ncbi:MAG TPA: PEGA domain-containing protein [Candidatus Angelobacter sp.]|nr:PEGA domain-containing protein [Candidatus Angelobacter sp.]
MNIKFRRRFFAIAILVVACAVPFTAQEPAQDTAKSGDTAKNKDQDTAKTTDENKSKDIEEREDKTAGKKGTVYVSVLPEEAYIWVDGKPAKHRSSSLHLVPGEHTVVVYNYGYEPMTETVTVAAGERKKITAHLKPMGGPVSGPWGRIQIEGVPGNSLVFLNGTTPEFFVGHADEMNNNFMATQRLIVPAGTHQLAIVRRKTDTPIWSGPIDVKENKRLIVYVKGDGKDPHFVYKDWSNGKKIASLKRFEAGTASATIAVAPVTGKLAADHGTVKCNEPAQLTWSSDGATTTTVIANNETLAKSAAGELKVQPHQTTKYEFRAAGPGGVVTSDATVNVDSTVHASLSPSAQELKYVKVGDKVQQQDSANLSWTATNADSVRIDPIGSVSGNSGSQTVQAAPQQSTAGPVNETQTYKLTASNVCGGSDTTTAAVHVTGSIEGEQVAEAQPPPPPPQELPHTATPLPLLALCGLASLGAGLLKMMRPS